MPIWPLIHLFSLRGNPQWMRDLGSHGPLYEGIGWVLGYSFIYALADYRHSEVEQRNCAATTTEAWSRFRITDLKRSHRPEEIDAHRA
jgi:hypothetical protein